MIHCAHAVATSLAACDDARDRGERVREKETDVQDRLQRNLTILFSVWDLNAYAVAARPLFDAWTLSHHTKQRRGKEEEGEEPGEGKTRVRERVGRRFFV